MLSRKEIGLYKREFEKEKSEKSRREKIKKSIRVQDNLRKYSKDWNGVSEIRKWREKK